MAAVVHLFRAPQRLSPMEELAEVRPLHRVIADGMIRRGDNIERIP